MADSRVRLADDYNRARDCDEAGAAGGSGGMSNLEQGNVLSLIREIAARTLKGD